ncbi:polyphosphate kinase 1 [Curvibacter sp. PAE-UM]|uniref:polyphosphate kinase 1 n=1 Tax=Curvibacter sp. PAE-UM TaxID=1714344 RepID=UPI0009EA75CB|nr:polyphosphate kinase 1 [Curvibacter sp. PAE-UM]
MTLQSSSLELTVPAESAQRITVPALLDRDQSILAFNERVFDWACRPEVPLLERLRYLCIVSSNLDEFFEVRAEPHLSAKQGQDQLGTYTAATFDAMSVAIHSLVERQYALYNDELMPAFEKEGIKIISHGDRNTAQRRWVKQYFEQEVRPLLIPVGLDPSHPFPQVANKSLNFIVRLGGHDAFGRENDVSIVKVPRALPRLICLPEKLCGKRRLFVSLSSVIRAHLAELFPGRDMSQFSQFRVTRHSDLAVDEDDVKNLRTALRQGLQHRHYGQAVRLEVSAGCSQYLSDFLLRQFELPEGALYRVHGPVNLVRLGQLVDLVDEPRLRFPAYKPSYPVQLVSGQSIFEQLKRGDMLIHQPYESFDGVLDFLRQAISDPQVLAIKQTIYRTGANSVLMDLLREAVRRGKEVTVVLELKARFDEEVNINWAEQLESIGVQVLYGVVGLKTHAKMMLVTRREGRHFRRYAHLSTGNYNPATARFYTDLSHLTADAGLTADIEHVFVHLAGQSRLPRLKHLWVAPFQLHRKLLEKIESLGAAAAAGQPARIVAKMNALTDEALIRALIAAGQKGAKIDLIVRGACMLPAQLPGQTGNIRVRSLIGRFLEHARVFYFRAGETEELYLSSADWMNRNMLRRVELAWPVLDPLLRQRIVDECLVAAMGDTQGSWELQPDGRYTKVVPAAGRPAISAQDALMARYALREPRGA